MQVLLEYALRLPQTEEGIACEGTALESHTVKVKKRAFLFVRAAEARLKLAASLKEAAALAAQQPERYSVGPHGWVLIKLEESSPYPLSVLKRWVKESCLLLGNSNTPSTTPSAPSRKLKKKSGKTP
jgi:hypothetical protein